MADGDLVTWASCGAMLLTGEPGRSPRAEPAGVAGAAAAAAADVTAMTGRFGAAIEVDGPALLGERAAIAGFERRGSVSVGGAARFERTADGWIVLNLPRSSDIELLPALVGEAIDPSDWPTVQRHLVEESAAALVERGAELRRGGAAHPTQPEQRVAALGCVDAAHFLPARRSILPARRSTQRGGGHRGRGGRGGRREAA